VEAGECRAEKIERSNLAMANASKRPRDLNVVGEVVRIHLSGADTGGAFALVENVSRPGGGPPPHIHSNEDEGFYVVEGDVEFLLGDRWVRAAAGTSLLGPRGVPHTFRNVGATPSRVLATIAPAGFERFFEEIDRLSAAGPPTPETLIALGQRYGLSFLPPG
jgi:quercetin dioxygenase-like cupin family protein